VEIFNRPSVAVSLDHGSRLIFSLQAGLLGFH